MYMPNGLFSLTVLPFSAFKASLSSRQIHRVFQDTFGETPKQYTQRLRLERAAFLLGFQHGSVLDVALAVGYESHEVFTRAFKRHFNVSPKEYRNKVYQLNSSKERHLESCSSDVMFSKIKIIELEPQHLAFVRSTGPYEEIDPSLWSKI